MTRKCADCGQFCTLTYDVWCNPYWNGIDREVCERCAVALGIGRHVTQTRTDRLMINSLSKLNRF